MPIVNEFEYFKPKTLDEALIALSKHKCLTRILAGGTDLIVRMKDNMDAPEAVIDIKGIPELKKLETTGSSVVIGSAVTCTELLESETVKIKLPAFWESLKTVACVGIRNRATVTGNICSAVPSADTATPLLAYGATIHLKGPGGEKTVPISEWFLGPKQTAICRGEIVTTIKIPLPEKKHGGIYVKLKRYEGEDLAQAGVTILVFADNTYRVAFCALCPAPKRAPKIEKLLNGNKLTDALIKKACALVDSEVCAITDIRSSKEYRHHMAKVMLERGLKAAVERLAGKGPALGHSII